MVVNIGLMVVLFVSISSSKCFGEDDHLPKIHGDTWGFFTGNRFSNKQKLNEPGKDLKFVFILVRHGMVAPFDKTYDFDMNSYKFGSTWRTDKSTKGGNQLMNMVGRSLKNRYQKYLDKLTRNEILLTTINQDWTVVNGEYLLQGLLHETAHKKVLEDKRIIKEGPENSKKCSWLNRILKELNVELDIPGNVVTLKYCTKKFYEALRVFVINKNEGKSKKDFWWIDSPQQVYNLWQVLWFEIQEGEGLHRLPKRYWANILGCVFEYHRLKLDWHPDVAPILVGRMFNYIKYEKEKSDIKFHIHISDGRTITNFMWNLPGDPRTLWVDYGDALILEFYEDESVSVSLFSGMMETFQVIHTYNFEELKKHFMERGIDLTVEEYYDICNFKPKV